MFCWCCEEEDKAERHFVRFIATCFSLSARPATVYTLPLGFIVDGMREVWKNSQLLFVHCFMTFKTTDVEEKGLPGDSGILAKLVKVLID